MTTCERIKPFNLQDGNAHVWFVPLEQDVAEVERLGLLLSKDELARADRFVTEDLRRRFVVSRGVLRQLLSEPTGVPAEQLQFRYEQWGKPMLKDPTHSDIQFNVSHSSDWAVVVLSSCVVGVDLEVPNDRINHKAIASQVVSGEEKAVWDQTAPKEHRDWILKLWVCKEAILKAMGLGIAEGLTKISFPVPLDSHSPGFAPTRIDPSLQIHLDEDGTCRMNAWLQPQYWSLRFLTELENCYAAICTPKSQELTLHREFV